MHADLTTLTQRIDRLEKTTRRWRLAALGSGLALAVVGLAAAAPVVCDIVTGERLVLRDEGGRTRVTLDAYHTETPALAFHDLKGKVRARLGVEKDGTPFLASYDEKGAQSHIQRFVAQPATQGADQREQRPATGPVSIAR